MPRYLNLEDLGEGKPCPTRGCGGYLIDDSFGEGLYCEVCQTRWRGL